MIIAYRDNRHGSLGSFFRAPCCSGPCFASSASSASIMVGLRHYVDSSMTCKLHPYPVSLTPFIFKPRRNLSRTAYFGFHLSQNVSSSALIFISLHNLSTSHVCHVLFCGSSSHHPLLIGFTVASARENTPL